ncbi:hypothetical protein [Halothiobacillus sp.]|uniref:hypothetical protein n=1 Tax=Halothiobacillus sp. TaxID=1891311 RepID=UPI002615B807|nr:hypothetical protein [Halothiobacillus sp.]
MSLSRWVELLFEDGLWERQLPALFKEAEKSWRKIRDADKIQLLKGLILKDGEPVRYQDTIRCCTSDLIRRS